MTQDEGFDHLLGDYEVPDAKRLAAALDRELIPFELESNPLTTPTAHRGSYGRMCRVRLWVLPGDQQQCEAIQARELGIC